MPYLTAVTARHAAGRTLALVAALIATLIVSTVGNLTATARGAEQEPAAPPKALVIVGPSSGSTSEFLAEGKLFADQAEAAGMQVTRIFHPNATWAKVKPAAQGANLVVYFGHGNGWPSPYAPFQEDTKNGFGLNATEGASAYSTAYYGANKIRQSIRLAPNAVVFLYRSCYTAGNAEYGSPIPTPKVALERVDNFAAGFLDPAVGAKAVFAYWTKQWVDYAGLLMQPGRSMKDLIQTPSSKPGWSSSGWDGSNPLYGESVRTPGAQMLLDPTPSQGYVRALSGDLNMSTDTWRGDAPAVGHEDDQVAPEVTEFTGVRSVNTLAAADDSPPVFTPNGDGISDTMKLTYTLSEPAYLQLAIRDQSDTVVRRITSWSDGGSGSTTWDGKSDAGGFVPEGRYAIDLTAKDPATNVSEVATTAVKVFKAMKSPAAGPKHFFARDADALAQATTLSVTLTKQAILSWEIMDWTGAPVRVLLADQLSEAGLVSIPWDGKDDLGNDVPDGVYTATATATTDAGTYSHSLNVRVMPFKITAPAWSGPTGTTVTFTILSAEELTGWPRIQIRQPGLSMYTGYPVKYSSKKSKVTVTMKSGGTAGDVAIKVIGTDIAGGKQNQTVTFALTD
jgi:flagellar hook assembly protein FlgD